MLGQNKVVLSISEKCKRDQAAHMAKTVCSVVCEDWPRVYLDFLNWIYSATNLFSIKSDGQNADQPIFDYNLGKFCLTKWKWE